MPFTTSLSGTAQVDDSVVIAFDQQMLIANAQEAIMDQFVNVKRDINAKAIEIPKYAQLGLATTPLDEAEDVASEAIADVKVTLTPKEYGKAVTRTILASLQTAGRIDTAAARVVGINMGRTQDKLALIAADASSNVLTGNGGAVNTQAAGDVMTVTVLNRIYNKLARASVAALAEGSYIAVMHDDVIHDLRNSTGAGSWQDVNKYGSPETVLKNEVGMLAGFRFVRDNHAAIDGAGGAGGLVDIYNSYFLAFNALGKAISLDPHGTLSGPFDKLGRFVNVGWHGVFTYGIVDQDALWVGKTSSSLGTNAA